MARDRVKTIIASRTRSTLDGHPEVKEIRAALVFPVSG